MVAHRPLKSHQCTLGPTIADEFSAGSQIFVKI
jgi:hypothetical protein